MNKPHFKVVYMAHPVSGDVEGNLGRARRWLKWLLQHCPEHAVIAPWITMCEVLSNDEDYATSLERDCAVVDRCDEVWLVGASISNGMSMEALAHARRGMPTVRDFTGTIEPSADFLMPELQFAHDAVKIN